MNSEEKQALIDEIVIQALRDDVRQWKQRAEAAEAKLANIVPPMMDDSLPGKSDSYIDKCDGWNACRAAILRNIEGVK